MAAKRFLNESGSDPDQPPEKRTRTRPPSLASVIGKVVMVNSLQNFFSALEPFLRRVVQEEVERGVRQYASLRCLTRSPSLRIQALEPSISSSLKLTFSRKLCLPIFTGSRITDIENNPLKILVVDTRSGHMVPPNHPIKIDMVVLDGDFPPADGNNIYWSKEEFENNIVKERTGKRPLLTGDVNVTLREGVAVAPIGDIEFTDNSSWIRSRKFRIGAKVAQGSYQGVRICEAITEAFVVKDHRGELYKKHHPPMLEDEVWRLEKIGKDGAFHKKLAAAGIQTVQDFLKLSTVDPSKLRRILGQGMSDKMWQVTINHARKCVMGNRLHVFHRPDCTVILNPICQVVKIDIDGQTFLSRDITCINRNYIENLMREAYSNWHSLQAIEGVLNETPLLTQGDAVEQSPDHNQILVVKPSQQICYTTEKSMDVRFMASGSNANLGCNNWQIQPTYISTSVDEPAGIGYSISESSSDGDLTVTPSRSRSLVN